MTTDERLDAAIAQGAAEIAELKKQLLDAMQEIGNLKLRLSIAEARPVEPASPWPNPNVPWDKGYLAGTLPPRPDERTINFGGIEGTTGGHRLRLQGVMA